MGAETCKKRWLLATKKKRKEKSRDRKAGEKSKTRQ